MAAEWMDFSFITGTDSIYGDKRVYPENVNAVDCNSRSPITENGSFALWSLFIFNCQFLRRGIIAASANKNADIISTKKGSVMSGSRYHN